MPKKKKLERDPELIQAKNDAVNILNLMDPSIVQRILHPSTDDTYIGGVEKSHHGVNGWQLDTTEVVRQGQKIAEIHPDDDSKSGIKVTPEE